MKKLQLNLDGLTVESFEPGTETRDRGTVRGHANTECSCAYTCGIASRGQEAYAEVPLTRYACCI